MIKLILVLNKMKVFYIELSYTHRCELVQYSLIITCEPLDLYNTFELHR